MDHLYFYKCNHVTMSDTGQIIRELHLLNALDVRYEQAAGVWCAGKGVLRVCP